MRCCERAKVLGVFGTKERSVINLANRDGIAAIVAQQFHVAEQIAAHGLVPIIEPEVNIKSPERDAADASCSPNWPSSARRDAGRAGR